tara:strand:+ start:158 stop:748 length:591 start_codon:yes stop_codon:yes gene_type:complete
MNIEQQLNTLKTGETLLVRALKTKTNKVQLEFAERIKSIEGNPGSLLAMLNASDPKFTSGARRAWIPVEISDASAKFGINLGDDASWTLTASGKDELILGLLNPTVADMRVRVLINETTVPKDAYQADNVQTTAKRKGANGDFIKYKGQYIFSNTAVALLPEGTEPQHVLLTPDTAVVAPLQVVGQATAIVDEVGI